MSKYDAVATRALAMIEKKGGDVVFPGAIVGTPGIYEPLTDTWSGGGGLDDATGKSVQIPDDPAQFAKLGLVLANPITLLVAAKGLGFALTPVSAPTFVWASRTYATKAVEAVAPDGDAILYTLIGSA